MEAATHGRCPVACMGTRSPASASRLARGNTQSRADFCRRRKWLAVALACWIVSVAAGCHRQVAPDFHGRWRPLNQRPVQPHKIPLHPGIRFAVEASDRTLKTTLERWTVAAGYRLEYRHSYDYGLHAGTDGIDAATLAEGVALLDRAYRPQHISISTRGKAVVVGDVVDPPADGQVVK